MIRSKKTQDGSTKERDSELDWGSIISAAYDTTGYDAGISHRSHPCQIGATASLFGRHAPQVSTAHILEIGCGRGNNLLSIAASLPESVCVGVDISEEQIKHARLEAEALGLTNIALIAADMTTLVGELEGFDYVICHGVYSWVSDVVRDSFFELCERFLSPHGLLYVSYNTLPGWSDYGLMRSLMLQLTLGQEWSDEITPLIDEWINALPDGVTRQRYEQLWFRGFRSSPDFYKRHGIFAEFNEPRYLTEVARQAERSGLGYVGDMSLKLDIPAAEYRDAHRRSEGRSHLERLQLLDLAQHTTFRSSVFQVSSRDMTPESSHIESDELQLTAISRLSMSANLVRVARPSATQINAAHELYPNITLSDEVHYYQKRDKLDATLIPAPTSVGRELLETIISSWPRQLSLRPYLERFAVTRDVSAELLPQLVLLLVHEDVELYIDTPTRLVDAPQSSEGHPKISAYNAHFIRQGATHRVVYGLHSVSSVGPNHPWFEFADLFDGQRDRARLLSDVVAHPKYSGSPLSAHTDEERALLLESGLKLFRRVGLIEPDQLSASLREIRDSC